ncbi:hypothetical protein Tco_1201531 [Tanacetum coccineum]
MYLLVGKDDALWPSAQLTKTPIGCTSYKLVYGRHVTLPNRDFPDCEDSHARSIHMSFTSSASFWESRSEERISKKRTKNEAKTTKPDTEWKSMEKTKPKGIAMLAISLFPITFAESMAVINLKEAQGPWMAEMKVLKALTEETQERRAET